MPDQNPNPLAHLTLGQATDYQDQYNPKLLQAVPRALNREPIDIGVNGAELPFIGVDLWTGYEVSWLNSKGLPQIAIAVFSVPAFSPNLIESKSFKLYLNSFNQTRIDDWSTVTERMVADLSVCAGASVDVQLLTLGQFAAQYPIQAVVGESLDTQDIQIDGYDYTPAMLRSDPDVIVEETLTSDLLKSNCLITNQPDWGSVRIAYKGPQIARDTLLQYLVSFRSHNEFHEQCVERIFQDLMRYCACHSLTVEARYTRRGGLDINPVRASHDRHDYKNSISSRTVRQ